MKYPVSNVRVGVVKGDQKLVRKGYHDSLNLKKRNNKEPIQSADTHKVHYVDLNPCRDPLEDILIPMGETKIVQIGT